MRSNYKKLHYMVLHLMHLNIFKVKECTKQKAEFLKHPWEQRLCIFPWLLPYLHQANSEPQNIFIICI